MAAAFIVSGIGAERRRRAGARNLFEPDILFLRRNDD
jgi:hypothetical protein